MVRHSGLVFCLSEQEQPQSSTTFRDFVEDNHLYRHPLSDKGAGAITRPIKRKEITEGSTYS